MNHKPEKKHEGKSETDCSDWSSLPVDILNIIVEKVQHFGDRLSLTAVCKDWRIPVTPRPLPWLVTFSEKDVFLGTSRSVTITFESHEICSNVDGPCQFRPYYKRSLEIATCADRIFAEPNPEASEWGRLQFSKLPPGTPFSDDIFIVQPRIKESKLGWLVVSMSYDRFIGEEFFQLLEETLFVYHPFSARCMSLPNLPLKHYTITFSGSDPTSPECVFFVIVYQDDNLSIQTWSPGQEVWKERHVNVIEENYDADVLCSVTWFNGIFYWCNNTYMESFNPSNGETKEIALPSQLVGIDLNDHYNKLFELNGEMLMFVYDILSTKSIELFLKFNPSEGTWIRSDDFLNDRLLFMSEICPSWYSVSGYGKTSSGRVFRNYDLRNHCQDDIDMKKKTAVECLMDCLSKTDAAINHSHVEWLAPPLKCSG